MMAYDGLLFDLDGTLWDATHEIWISWSRVLEQQPDIPYIPSEVELEQIMGLTGDELMQKLFPHLTPQRGMEIFDACVQEEVAYLITHGGKLYDGIVDMLNTLSQQYPLFIVSNCGKGYIEAFLQAHQLSAYFNDTECAGNTGLAKSENIRLVVTRNGLQRPVYIGDTVMDKTAAERAEVPFIFAAYGFGRQVSMPQIETPLALIPLMERSLS